MGSIVNQKGGYYTTLEVFRDQENESVTTLTEAVLKQTENYICQTTSFVTNLTPDMSTFSEALLTVKNKPTVANFGANWNTYDLVHDPAQDQVFQPVNCKSTVELARQLHVFCEGVPGVSVEVGMDFTVRFTLSAVFGNHSYLELSDVFRDLVGFRSKFIHHFYAGNPGVLSPELFMNETQFNAVYGAPNVFAENRWFIQPVAPPGAVPNEQSKISNYSLRNMDTRVSLDVTLTIPHASNIEVLDAKEGRVKILARFPLKDFQDEFLRKSLSEMK